MFVLQFSYSLSGLWSHLELIRDLGDEGGDLFHETVHAALAAGLQQGGDGQGSDAAVGVGDQVLQVQVACGHRWRMLHCHLFEPGLLLL